jgi:hypothetical protein
MLRVIGITDYTVSISPKKFAAAAQWTPITVTIEAPVNDVLWLPAPKSLSGKLFSASCTLPK